VRRILVGTFLLTCLGAGVILSAGGCGSSGGSTYKVVLDNAFGLTQGADMKVEGVRAGKVKSLDVDRKTARAIGTVSVSRNGFSSFR
jgi:ABC-type transporter Mla subunit MlaD